MPRKGDLKPMDAWEESIRENAIKYNVVLFMPGSSSRVYNTSETIKEAIQASNNLLGEFERARAAMIYAVAEDDRFAMVGSVDRSGRWKPVKPKTY